MGKGTYLIFHKDHPLDVCGVNSGAEMATLFLARALSNLGYRAIVAGQLIGGEQTSQGVEFWDLGVDYDVAGALIRARDIGPYHLVTCGRALPLLDSRVEKNCLSRVLITQDRAGNDTGIKPEILCRAATKVVCVSEAQKQVFIQSGADPTKLMVLYNGADFSIFKEGNPEKRDYRKLVFVGALVPDKGIHFLVESFVELKAKYPDLTLDVYGSSSLWGREKFFDEKEIEAKVSGIKFHGKTPQSVLARAYAEAGLCVVPSIWFDPFPLVAIEAQACGCPVLVTDVGGLKEGVEEGVTGMVLREITRPALTMAIDQMVSRPDRLKEMSRQAILRSRPKYTWEIMAEGIIAASEAGQRKISGKGKEAAPPISNTVKTKIGYLTTWNQQCGLATYARYMLSAFKQGTYLVLGEDVELGKDVQDEDYVIRCWKRGSSDFGGILAAIQKYDIGLLHLNCHYRFFPQPDFSRFIQGLREKGIKVVIQLHNPYTLDGSLAALVCNADSVLVHTPENRLEVIANGANPETVKVVPHGVDVKVEISTQQKEALRERLGIPRNAKVIVSFGFIQPHKGMEGVIEGVASLSKNGIDGRGYIVGRPMEEDPGSREYLQKLRKLSEMLNVADRITILDRFVSDDEVTDYLQASDVVLMNYHSQYYEASGACSLAVGAGAVVAASIAPPFASFGDAVWHITSGFPASLAISVLLCNDNLRQDILSKARSYCREHSWGKVFESISKVYLDIGFEPTVTEVGCHQGKRIITTGGCMPIKVLMNNRPNMYTQAGGDTVVVDNTIKGLTARGVKVSLDLEGKLNPADFDIVHIFNFATPDITRRFAEKAHVAGVPYVVTTLCEDVPSFHNQSRALAGCLIEYVRAGQDREWWRKNKIDLSKVPCSPSFNNSWTAENAAGLLANGDSEGEVLRKTYPGVKNIVNVKLGYEVGEKGNAELFYREHGIKDFILCVGRIESRKNQLMLLKALEDSDLPVVLAGGGFTYQPDYDEAVRRFKRKGKTLVLGRLSAEMLASAYACAKVHVLASWYELPGLVSLEAAYHGCNVVVTANGTAPDYFGDLAFYCDPSSEQSISNAVMAAYYSPVRVGLKEKVMENTWDLAAENTLKVYEKVTGKNLSGVGRQTSYETSEVSSVKNAQSEPAPYEEYLGKGERAAQAGNFTEANGYLDKAETMSPESETVLRTRGAVFLAGGNSQKGKAYFEKVLAKRPNDARCLCGLGMCEMNLGGTKRAHGLFVKALDIEPDQMTALHELVRCSYEINKYDELESALKKYVSRHSAESDMEFCLAGCLYKEEKYSEAEPIVKRVLTLNPEHRGARELERLIAEKRTPLQGKKTIADEKVVGTLEYSGMPKETASSPVIEQPSDIGARLNALEQDKHERRFDKASEGIRAILALPNLAENTRLRALCLEAELMAINEKLEDSEKQFRKVLERDGRHVRAICGLGALAANSGRWDEAKNQFNAAIGIEPGSDVALAGLGLCSMHGNRPDMAWDYFQKALKHNPENKRALMGLIEVGYPLNKLSEIELAIRSYLEMHPADLEFLYSLAGCCYAQNKVSDARIELDKIIIFNPEHKRAIELKEIIEGRKKA